MVKGVTKLDLNKSIYGDRTMIRPERSTAAIHTKTVVNVQAPILLMNAQLQDRAWYLANIALVY